MLKVVYHEQYKINDPATNSALVFSMENNLFQVTSSTVETVQPNPCP